MCVKSCANICIKLRNFGAPVSFCCHTVSSPYRPWAQLKDIKETVHVQSELKVLIASYHWIHLGQDINSFIKILHGISTFKNRFKLTIFWPNDGIRNWVLILVNRSIEVVHSYSYAVSIGRCLLSNYKSPNEPCIMSMREIRLSALKIKKTDENFLCSPRSANSVASVFDVKKI